MNDGIGGASHRHRGAVLEGLPRLDLLRRQSFHTISTMHRPHTALIRMWLASATGTDDAPGSVMAMASAIAVMLLAVPMVMQVP